MTWQDPADRQTGGRILAAIWTQDVVDNVQVAYDLAEVAIIETPFVEDGDPILSSVSRLWALGQIGSGGTSRASFSVPSDYASIQKAVVLFEPDAMETMQFDTSVYVAAGGVSHATHTSSGSSLTASATADQLLAYDISSHMGSINEDDQVLVKLTSEFAHLYPVKVYVEYLRA